MQNLSDHQNPFMVKRNRHLGILLGAFTLLLMLGTYFYLEISGYNPFDKQKTYQGGKSWH